MRDLTVIYYTANRERPEFEAKIQRALLEVIGDLPLISVSHHPMDFGHNICVGDVGVCGQNAIRQFQIGAQEATTRFVCSAEADFLYPPERFTFAPQRDDVFYGVTHWYVLWAFGDNARSFTRKVSRPLGPITAGRDLLIKSIERHLSPQGSWWCDPETNGQRLPGFYGTTPLEPLFTTIPCVTFKTDQNMHRKTANIHRKKLWEIPHWGRADTLCDAYLGSG